MDQERFDDLTRRLGGSDSRRRLLLGAAALAAAGMGLGFELEEGEALGKFCRIPGSP